MSLEEKKGPEPQKQVSMDFFPMKVTPEEVPSLSPDDVEKHNALVEAYPDLGPEDSKLKELEESQKKIDAARSPL